MDFNKYKPRLKEYLRQKGVATGINPAHCFNTDEHKHGDKNPSLQIYGDVFRCFACGISGDIYDAVRFFEKLENPKKQYEFLRMLYGA
jgi:hypothetical protein